MKYCFKHINRILLQGMFLSLFFVILPACISEDHPSLSSERDVAFKAYVFDDSSIKTRGVSEEDDIQIPKTAITHGDYETQTFYMQMIAKKEANGQDIYNLGTYTIATAQQGILSPSIGADPLQWQSLITAHTFYGWTMPFYTDGSADERYKEGIKGNYNPNPENPEPIQINFLDTDYSTYFTINNNSIYEKFIGVKEGPVFEGEDLSYVNNGEYVELNFRHLVSKIKIQEFTCITSAFTEQQNLPAVMTIYGMPNSATFYPHPTDRDVKALALNNGGPAVVPSEANEESAMKFYILNGYRDNSDESDRDYFYIPPEVDFSKLSFSISVTHQDFKDRFKDCRGTFENVVFRRPKDGTDWGDPDKDVDDSTILHAGEMMSLRIVVYEYGGDGVTLVIEPWSTSQNDDAPHHSKQGIYYDYQFEDILNASSEDIERLQSLYCEEKSTTFNLYENMTTDDKSLEIYDGYVLDGKDHLITVTGSSTVTVKNLKNVYITDGNRNYIYIDDEGNIYKIDGNTMQPDPAEPKDKLEANKSSIINLETGEVVENRSRFSTPEDKGWILSGASAVWSKKKTEGKLVGKE